MRRKTKAVIFDFDGTLTEKNGNLWKKIWKFLGHDIGEGSYYVSLYKKFIDGQISHRQWCELTCEAFQEKNFNKKILDKITDNMTLINGAEELIKYIHSQGIEMHIVSGNIVSVIEKVLGENKKYLCEIRANEFVFDENDDLLSEIVGTEYDHIGKAIYIKELCQKKGFQPEEVLFVGNSMNDEWVYQSGARTFCVNPDETKVDNAKIWNKVVFTDNLFDLKEEIF
ncbi:MAG: HAD-IB family phosphatase [Clostridia bacterium]|nr:HAD-IB family phosphatase [Clostridia bacterium]